MVTPLGRDERRVPGDWGLPGVNLGKVMPFFCRHSRNAANPRPGGRRTLVVLDGVVEAFALALVEDELVDELPHAANVRLASMAKRVAVAVGVRRRLLMI
ncbi:MAG TPA: hypothetical protein VIH71_16615 [Solirubrobacteraceae bacterium]